MSNNRAVYAQRAAVLFAVSILIILVLNFMQKHDLIDPQFEGLCRIAINGVFGSIILFGVFRAPLPRALKLTIILAVSAALGETFLDYSEDVPAWATIPFIGQESTARRSLESILAAGWMCGGVCIVLMSIRLIRNSHEDMTQTIARLQQSEEELKQSNEQRTNAIQELQEAQHQLVQNERLSALGQMASGVAHDLNNALTPAVMYTEMLLMDDNAVTEETRGYIECIHQSIGDAVSTVENLQFFYTRDEQVSSSSATGLDILVRQVVAMTRPKWKDEPEQRGQSVEVELQLSECPPSKLSATDFRILLTNLLFNAIEAMPDGGQIRVQLRSNQTHSQLSVSDTGCGMSEETSQRCFEPFYTTRPRGSGLGLSACYGLVQGVGGTIEVESSSEGTTFHISLPNSSEAVTATAGISEPHDAGGPCRVLLVDDDEGVLEATTLLLETIGATVTTAPDGPAAIATMRQHGPFDVVVTDLGMANMDGRAVIEMVRRIAPKQRVAVVSGWAKSDVFARFEGMTAPDIVLQKPLTIADLRQLVDDDAPSHFAKRRITAK